MNKSGNVFEITFILKFSNEFYIIRMTSSIPVADIMVLSATLNVSHIVIASILSKLREDSVNSPFDHKRRTKKHSVHPRRKFIA